MKKAIFVVTLLLLTSILLGMLHMGEWFSDQSTPVRSPDMVVFPDPSHEKEGGLNGENG